MLDATAPAATTVLDLGSHVDGSRNLAGRSRGDRRGDAAARDRSVVIPLVLLLVLLVLVALLRFSSRRSILVAIVVATYLAALGLSWSGCSPACWGSRPSMWGCRCWHSCSSSRSACRLQPLPRHPRGQEAAERGTRDGMLRALAATGGVITSAGILLAAVFTVLGVLPRWCWRSSEWSSGSGCCSTRSSCGRCWCRRSPCVWATGSGGPVGSPPCGRTLRSGHGQRQPHGERGALAGDRLDADPAAVGGHDARRRSTGRDRCPGSPSPARSRTGRTSGTGRPAPRPGCRCRCRDDQPGLAGAVEAGRDPRRSR